MTAIRVTVGRLIVDATLDESQTARQLAAALPFESRARRWGDEVYFGTPIEAGADEAREEVPPGTVAYWPPGRALCLFFGQKPYSPVNVVGHLDGDPRSLSVVEEGEPVRVERI